ncbi:MCP methyltransferase, CheR-type [Sulfurimonas gotlandica GD1]|uniref:protein-glutamate O-methyltransferase n=1 Tax=Sulfurimonas gotlandica (strain DSM 19862 / JCM 16533 / GD1) TaxID=929558 RepID=B6BJA5_SULGG|nr:protein-glutamate O-methyltransferase CheR [Sulfurimonas gotlandica]EDZ63769.1 CheR methyltransferase, SAM binding domain [Sulfurimonas gotlandica GD1]EHP30626.1 MCP methyltransferase, CheR-type [Sulfurimonas gotlandica GD1]
MPYEKELSHEVFEKFQELIYHEIGINLSEHKRTLVQTRLRKWLIKFELNSYSELYEKIADDKSDQMLIMLVNAITTNVTSFFREDSQWIYLLQNIDTMFDRENKRIRIWSAACSSGEEPYSILMFLKEHLNDFHKWDIKILATDISENMLQHAQNGIYEEKNMQSIPKHMKYKYFIPAIGKNGGKAFAIKDELKKYIIFRSFNLVTGDYTIFKNKFDVIFCRNVMIYFDRKTQDQLLFEFTNLLRKGSRVFVGHSESIQNKKLNYKLVSPSIYQLK